MSFPVGQFVNFDEFSVLVEASVLVGRSFDITVFPAGSARVSETVSVACSREQVGACAEELGYALARELDARARAARVAAHVRSVELLCDDV